MLFVLDKSLADNLDQEPVRTALEYIALARREGKHLVFSDMKTMRILATSECLPARTRQIYQKIFNRLPSKKAYRDALIRYALVVSGDIGVEASNDWNTGRNQGICQHD